MLPFTHDQFLDVFATYNERFWPFIVTSWLLAALTCAAIVYSPARRRFIVGALSVQWAWAGLAYHAALFTVINPAAWMFAALFLAEAALLVSYGVVSDRVAFSNAVSARVCLGWVLMAYALTYPVIAIAEGHAFPRTPTFGIPCPTTILTIGALLAASRPPPFAVAVVPVLWAMVGGSAAVLLDVRADLMLPVAASLLIGDLVLRRPVGHAPAVRPLP